MSQNQKNLPLNKLGAVYMDMSYVLGDIDKLESAEPIYARLLELADLKSELSEAENAIEKIHRDVIQPLVNAIWTKGKKEREVKEALLAAKNVKSISDLPLAAAQAVLRLREQVLREDTEYTQACKDLDVLNKALVASQYDAYECQRINISAALEAALEANNG